MSWPALDERDLEGNMHYQVLEIPRNASQVPTVTRYTPFFFFFFSYALSPPRLPFPFPPAPPTRTVHLPSTIYHPRPLPPPFRTPP